MTREKFSTFDSADYLKTDADIEAFLAASAEGGDPTHYVRALASVARARSKNMAALAKKAGMSREGLYGALSGTGNPTLATMLKILWALDLQMGIKTSQKPRRPAKERESASASA